MTPYEAQAHQLTAEVWKETQLVRATFKYVLTCSRATNLVSVGAPRKSSLNFKWGVCPRLTVTQVTQDGVKGSLTNDC